MKKIAILAVLLFAAAAAVKAAEAPAAKGKAQEPAEACKADVEKFCKDVTPGGGRIMACLKAYEDKISEGCKATREKGKERGMEKMKKFMEACKTDMDKLCKDVKGGHGEKVRCLKQNEKSLSAGCATELKEAGEQMKKHNPCLADIEKFCKDVKPGEGRIIACLKTHEAELSAACKANKGKPGMDGKQGRRMGGRAAGGEGFGGAPEGGPDGAPQGEPPAEPGEGN